MNKCRSNDRFGLNITTTHSSFLALGTKNITVSAPTAPAMGTMILATEPAGINTKVDNRTMAAITPTAPAFWVDVMPPRRW